MEKQFLSSYFFSGLFNVASFLSNFTKGVLHYCFGIEINFPEFDSYFGKEWKETREKRNEHEAESTHVMPLQTTTGAGSMFNISPQNPSNRSYKLVDPAAVTLNQWQSLGEREKIV